MSSAKSRSSKVSVMVHVTPVLTLMAVSFLSQSMQKEKRTVEST